MKKVLLTLALLVFLLSIGIYAIADGYINVNESATKDIAPNQAEISIGIETSDKSIQKATEENKKIANKIYSSLKLLLGIDDSIKTSNYSINPQYIYTRENQQVLDKYIVSNMVIIKTKKINIVSKLIDTASAQGATNIQGLQFSATGYEDSCEDMLADLTKKAYKKANTIAKSINLQITGVQSINTSCNSENNYRPVYALTKATMQDSIAVSTPIESGKLKIQANIDASFNVK